MITGAELICLALNVYWEARDQPIAGQVAVAQVVVNRVESPKYPNTVCAVVRQYKQFSWYWDGKSDNPMDLRAWEQSQLVSSAVAHGSVHADLTYATHYHADYVDPHWADDFKLVATIGDHLFYE